MKLYLDSNTYFETNEPLDISIPLIAGSENLTAWYVDPPKFEPVQGDGFVGSVKDGGSVNFRNISFNPHGHGTHTECLGHITPEVFSVNESLKEYFFKAVLITVDPKKVYNEEFKMEDLIIYKDQLEHKNMTNDIDALIIRTLPNSETKLHMHYSATNPAYLDLECIEVFEKYSIKHLLIDLPSVDREMDKGLLNFHHAFWKVPESPEHFKTITELIYVDSKIEDGIYMLEMQMASFVNDASPSRPVLYKLKKVD